MRVNKYLNRINRTTSWTPYTSLETKEWLDRITTLLQVRQTAIAKEARQAGFRNTYREGKEKVKLVASAWVYLPASARTYVAFERVRSKVVNLHSKSIERADRKREGEYKVRIVQANEWKRAKTSKVQGKQFEPLADVGSEIVFFFEQIGKLNWSGLDRKMLNIENMAIKRRVRME